MNTHAPDLSAPRGPKTGKNGFHTVPNQVRMGRNAIAQNVTPQGLRSRTLWKMSQAIVLGAFIVALFIGAILPLSARPFYVSKSGSDSNSGTDSGRPFITVTRALAVARNGDQLFIGPGIYPESVTTSAAVSFHAWGGVATIGPVDVGPSPSLDVDAGDSFSVAAGTRTWIAGSATVDNVADEIALDTTWTVDGNPASVIIEQPKSLGTHVTFKSAGSFTLRLRVQAPAALGIVPVEGTVVVKVDPVPGGVNPVEPPFSVVAEATESSVVGICDCTRVPTFEAGTGLRGVVVSAGASPAYTWELLSGSGNVAIASPNSKVTSVKMWAPGCYVFRLTVRKSETSETLSSEVKVSVKPTPAKGYLKIAGGPRCAPNTAPKDPSPTYLQNSHGCAAIWYQARVTWLENRQVFGETITGTLAAGESRLLKCGSANIHILGASYESGCGAGDLDTCGPLALHSVQPDSRMIVLRDGDRTPVVILESAPAVTNVVQASSDGRQWTTLTNLMGGNQPIIVPDPQAGQGGLRTYRAYVQ